MDLMLGIVLEIELGVEIKFEFELGVEVGSWKFRVGA